VGDLHKFVVVPGFALSSKWNVGVVPVELLRLRVLEQLLVTKRFHVTLVLMVYSSVGGGDLWFSFGARPFTQPSLAYHAQDLPLHKNLQHTVLAVEFHRRPDLNRNV
jgi:hypothetical protein